jgi:hypothetical protein
MTAAFIMVAIYVIFFVIKNLSPDAKDADVDARPLDGEAFPTVEIFNEQAEEPFRTVSSTVNSDMAKAVPGMVKQEHRPKVNPKEKKNKPVAAPLQESEEKNPVSLRKRSEAKKAFIHAEILNRKY